MLFVLLGLTFTIDALVEFSARYHSHGLIQARQFMIVGPMLAFAGIASLFDKS